MSMIPVFRGDAMKIKRIIYKFKGLTRLQQIIACLFFLSFFWVLASGAYSMIHQHLIETMTVGAQYTDVVYSDYGFIQAEEVLVTADKSGEVQTAVEESERVPKNNEVFTIISSDEKGKQHETHYYAPISGIVSYRIDGYEKMTDINEIKKLDFRGLYEESVNDDRKRDKKANAEAGKPYAKIIDNLQETYIYMSYDPEKNAIFEQEGDVFRIRFPELNESTTGTVEEIVDNGEGKKFCKISLGPVSESFLMNRVAQTEVYQIETATLKLPKKSLVYADGDAGVYIVNNGTVQWQRVKVLHEGEEKVECETLAEGTVVVLTPKRVSPGDVVKGS